MTDLDKEPFEILALVQMNNELSMVLNRTPRFVYDFHKGTKDLIGRDGPFYDALKYELPSRGFEAFAGREFDIPLSSGETVKACGQYWQVSVPNTTECGYNTIDGLKNCYVFFGGARVDSTWWEKSIGNYKGGIYPYWDYKKVLKHDYWMKEYFKKDSELISIKKKLVHKLKALAQAGYKYEDLDTKKDKLK